MIRGRTKMVWLYLLLAGCEGCVSAAQPPPPPPPPPVRGGQVSGQVGVADGEGTPGVEGPVGDTASEVEVRVDPDLPVGSALAGLDDAACLALLDRQGVDYEPVAPEEAEGVEGALRLDGPLGDVEIAHVGRSELHETLDCRLAVTLLAWAPVLRAAGVVRIEHMSVYRPNARVRRTGDPSGHAAGTAIDAAHFVRDDGRVIEVETVWVDRRRGVAPCPGKSDDSEDLRWLRGLVCDAVDANLFQIVVTPHANRAHRNHVHLEIRPEVEWRHVR